MKTFFKNAVLAKSFLFMLIVFWGGYNTMNANGGSGNEYFTDFGSLLFMVFSFLYLLNAFFLFKFKILGSRTYLPLVLLFVFLGFLGEIFNPMQITRDYFYLIVFYVISPLFFITQGVVLSMIISKRFQENFH